MAKRIFVDSHSDYRREGSHTRSFSADTGMAECLLIAKKSRPVDQGARATFVILAGQPENALEGELLAQVITTAVASRNVRTLEGGPFGGTRISLGETFREKFWTVRFRLRARGKW